MADQYLVSPGARMDPGDIFLQIPFPNMKWPLEALRPYPKHAVPQIGVPYMTCDSTELRAGDIVKVGISRKTVMMLSDGCEIDRILENHKDSLHKRHWLAAPLDRLSICNDQQRERVVKGLQPNKFYIPADERLGGEEMFVDLRRITPVNCMYFINNEKSNATCTLAPKYKDDLKAKLLEFFTGLALLTYFECPNCREPIDTRDLIAPYDPEPEPPAEEQ